MKTLRKIFIAIPNTGTIRTETVSWLLGQKDHVLFMPQAKPHDVCRNVIVNEFLKTDSEWLLMVDSDVVPPQNVTQMIENNVDICSAFVCANICGEIIPVGMTKNSEGYHHEFRHSEPLLHKVDVVGTGCILIKRKVFDNLSKPYFRFRYDTEGFLTNGEDFDFCERVEEDIFFDARFVCKHFTVAAI